MKICENRVCHFTEFPCRIPVPKSVLLKALEKGSNVAYRPSLDSSICTNCILGQLLQNSFYTRPVRFSVNRAFEVEKNVEG